MAEQALLRAFHRLGSPRALLAIAAIALLLCSSSLGGERTLDDWLIALVARGDGATLGFSSHRWDCFRFTTGDPLRNATMIGRGVLLPWWTEPTLKLAFFRPLAAGTHVLDALAWPGTPLLSHAHSLLWFGLLLVAVAAVYRQCSEHSRLANLAFALYAWDDARGATLSWLANRNALISGAFGCACIAAHDLWRRSARRRYVVVALLCFALSGLAGELAVGALAYLIAYAAFLDPAPWRARFQSLYGYGVLTAVWRISWSLRGYGAHGSGAYVDPLADPLGFLAGAPRKWLSLLQAQLGIIPADLAFLGPTGDQRLWTTLALGTLIGAAILLRPCVEDARGRFWLCGALLSLFPMAASFPSDRLLLFVGLGFAPLLARAFALTLQQIAARPHSWPRRLQLALGGLFFAVHGVLAPLLLPLRAGQMGRMARAEAAALADLRALVGTSSAPVVILNAPSPILTSYAQLRLAVERQTPFSAIQLLSAADSPIEVTYDGSRGVTLRAEHGFLRTPVERHYRADAASLERQGSVKLPGINAEVTELRDEGRPFTARFTLLHEPSSYVFACWMGGRYRSCRLPAPGDSLRLPPAELGQVLLDSGAGAAS